MIGILRPLAVLLATTFALANLGAQVSTFPLDPRRTFLRTNSDAPLPPLVLDLATLPAAPGTWLRLESTGAFRHINGGLDNYRSLVGMFSSSNQVLATTLLHRVPDAIAAGGAYAGGATYYGGLPMDVPEDFFVSRNTWATGVYVEVPPTATHLFLGVLDSLYNDNVDPNGDYAVVVTVVGPLPLPGTGEHLELRTGVGAAATALPADKQAPGGALLIGELSQPVGFLDGDLYVIAADLMATGGPAPQMLPRVWLGTTAVVVQLGSIPGTPGWSATWSLTAPHGLLGTSLILQGGALSSLARNGLYETTIAHRFAFQ